MAKLIDGKAEIHKIYFGQHYVKDFDKVGNVRSKGLAHSESEFLIKFVVDSAAVFQMSNEHINY